MVKLKKMKYIIYLIVYPILWCISMLPFPLLYLFSDFVYIILYRIIGYRKKTVRANLKLTLPHLTEKELLIIEKKFYHHLCDLFLEMIKTMSISKEEICKRYVFKNFELYAELEKQDKSVVIMCAHYASYEWVVSMNYYTKFKGYGIYKKIKNPYFHKLVHSIRSKYNATLISTKETIRRLHVTTEAKYCRLMDLHATNLQKRILLTIIQSSWALKYLYILVPKCYPKNTI